MFAIGVNNLQLLGSTRVKSQKILKKASDWFFFKGTFLSKCNELKKNHRRAKSVDRGEKSSLELGEVEFSDKLVKWAIQNQISHLSFSKLLKILSEQGIKDLPKNSQSLMRAKEAEIKVSKVPPGVYTHIGFEKNLKNLISHLLSKNLFNETEIKVSIFIDHLPLSIVTQRGLWVILGSVEGFTKNIFIIGAYCGFSRPKNSNLFLSEFVEECKHLCTEGLEMPSGTFKIKISRLICDLPAKAFVLKINSNGYSSCTKCDATGNYKSKRICFMEKGSPRTDEDFKKKDLYQGDKTKLLEIPGFGVVSNVPLDYMHLVCMGVLRKLMSIWQADESYWVSEEVVNDLIQTLAKMYPCDFQRKPKAFKHLSRWTASEFRQFLLFYGPVFLKKNLKKNYYEHFLLLHIACRLLCLEATTENINQGKTLLNDFVLKFNDLYHEHPITHNFHGLYHLADECVSHGTLDNFSAFPFEKFLIKLRNSMEKCKKKSIPHSVLQHSHEKLFTKSLSAKPSSTCQMSKKLKVINLDQFNNFSHFEKLSFRNFEIIPGKEGDKYVILKDNKIVEVMSVLKKKSEKTHFIAGQEFSSVCNFHSKPFDSLPLRMFKVGKPLGAIHLWPVDMINTKCMKVPNGNDETVMIGLLEEHF